MKVAIIIALAAGVTAHRLANKYVDENGKVHPLYLPNDESEYEERYMAITRNQEKKKEALSQYGSHPTMPKGYAWDTFLPAEQSDTQGSNSTSTTSRPTQRIAPTGAAPSEAVPVTPAAPIPLPGPPSL